MSACWAQVEADEGDSGDENDSPPAAAATTPAGATDQAQPRSGNPPPRSTPNRERQPPLLSQKE